LWNDINRDRRSLELCLVEVILEKTQQDETPDAISGESPLLDFPDEAANHSSILSVSLLRQRIHEPTCLVSGD
jgi:hypothetical protein